MSLASAAFMVAVVLMVASAPLAAPLGVTPVDIGLRRPLGCEGGGWVPTSAPAVVAGGLIGIGIAAVPGDCRAINADPWPVYVLILHPLNGWVVLGCVVLAG